jgi:hypothetical protein
MRVGLHPTVGVKLDRPLFNGARRGLQRGIPQKPLFAQIRFDRHMAAFAVTDVMRVRFDLEEQFQFFELFHHGFARFHTIQTDELLAGFAGHAAVGGDDHRERQLMAQGHLVVSRVMGWGDLDAAGAELGIDEIVGNDGDRLVLERQEAAPTEEVLVAWVGRVYGHGLVTEHGFGSGGSDDDKGLGHRLALGIQQRILEMPKVPLLLGHDHLLVGECGPGRWIPMTMRRPR